MKKFKSSFVDLPLKTENVSDAQIPKAHSCVQGILQSPFCEIVSILKIISDFPTSEKALFEVGDEIIVFDTEVEIPQYSINDIKSVERIAIIFHKTDKFTPWVYALREGFPEVVHTNMFFKGFPTNLCIYDIDYEELKISWSSPTFIEDIRNWLKKTALDKLHHEGQQLEPLILFDAGNIILPFDIVAGETLFLYNIKQDDSDKLQILGSRIKAPALKSFECNLLIFEGNSQKHGLINNIPQSVSDLCGFVEKAGINLKEHLVNSLKDLKSQGQVNVQLLLVFLLPKKRNSESDDVIVEEQVFLLPLTVKEVGIRIGLWQEFEGQLVDLYLSNMSKAEIPIDSFQNIPILLLKPHKTLNKKLAQKLNGIESTLVDFHFFTIGLGALGSQVFLNMARAGFGKWTLIDYDLLLPHNLARHGLLPDNICAPKVEALSRLGNSIVSNSDFAFPINENIIRPKNENARKIILERLQNSDIILDFSASVAVPRFLSFSDDHNPQRILSAFLNPTGNYLVILLEDNAKSITIDWLEMLMYRELSANNNLNSYFPFDASKVRYSNACRDLSSQISQDLISAHAATVSLFVKKKIDKVDSQAIIFKYDHDELVSKNYEILITKRYNFKCSDWEIVFDQFFLDKISSLRDKKLPKETGGILIGSWDVQFKRIYIIDTIIPENNAEYPTFFYRGAEGLRERLSSVSKLTGGAIKYIGEWHSHPKGCSVSPSNDDLKLLAWLTENMSIENLPAVMLILGDDNKFNICFGQC